MANQPGYTPRGSTRGAATYYDAEHTRTFRFDTPFRLQSGAVLPRFELAYETYGELSATGDNAILICHAFTGSAHAAGHGEGDGYGWWEGMVGPGRAFDPQKHFIICSNVLGGCYGSTGPLSLEPGKDRHYGARFPVVTIEDMVDAQKLLLDSLGVSRLRSVVGGSMGGMQALSWAIRYPDAVAGCIPIGCAASLSPYGIAYHSVGRRAVMDDPEWNGGDYDPENPPLRGLMIARQLAHIIYLNHEAMQRKFERRVAGGNPVSFTFQPEFEVESYLAHQGETFVQRFDPNSYLYLSRAMDYFDLGAEQPLEELCSRIKARVFSISYEDDGQFPIEDARALVRALRRSGVDTTSLELPSPNGHDTFLTDTATLVPLVRDFIEHTPL